jgi:LPXTG-motif cell wall-anchored protein
MKALSALLVASTIGLVAIPAAKADDYDKMTKITVNEPVRLPTMTLQPGNYSLRLLEATGNRHVVEVRDENGKGLGLILALPNYRLVPKDRTVISYWETPPGQPRAMRAWFFPGDNFGQEFIYPKEQASQIAGYTGGLLPDASADLKTAKVENFDESNSQPPVTLSAAPAPAPVEVAAATAPPAPQPEPQVIAQATPPPTAPSVTPADPAPAPAPDQLPQTGSELPMIGLIGVLSLAALLATVPGKRGRV